MTKFAFTLLTAATLAAPALAETSRPLDFVRSGIRYVATVTDRDDGTQVIAGREVASGRAFDLSIVNGRVTGLYDGQPVGYTAPRNKLARPTKIALGL